MKLVVRYRCGECRARAGLLYLGNRSHVLETPCLLLCTRKGLPTFIPPDLLPSIHPDALALHASPLHFFDSPSAKTLASAGGLHKLISLPGYTVAAIARDFVCIAEHGSSNKIGASFQTPFGRRTVKPVDYMDVINAMQPDIWASLPDEVPSWVTHKRNKQSVERTLNWLDSCISLKKDGMESGLGCIVGGNSVEERGFCAQEVAKRDVSGFCLSGFGLGESAEERGLLLEAIMKNLPDEKARQISGLDLPEEVLQAVSAGIDVFDSTYPHSLTMSGLAMVFPLDMEECLSGRTSENANDVGSDFTKINLRAVAYRNDTSPILESCRCYTCSKHTKAYINHLLNTHEMLAQTLLDIHNTHHYMNFFQAIRNAIQGGYFADFKAWFASRRQAVNEGILVSSAA